VKDAFCPCSGRALSIRHSRLRDKSCKLSLRLDRKEQFRYPQNRSLGATSCHKVSRQVPSCSRISDGIKIYHLRHSTRSITDSPIPSFSRRAYKVPESANVSSARNEALFQLHSFHSTRGKPQTGSKNVSMGKIPISPYSVQQQISVPTASSG
jgi:hypothetical protein